MPLHCSPGNRVRVCLEKKKKKERETERERERERERGGGGGGGGGIIQYICGIKISWEFLNSEGMLKKKKRIKKEKFHRVTVRKKKSKKAIKGVIMKQKLKAG